MPIGGSVAALKQTRKGPFQGRDTISSRLELREDYNNSCASHFGAQTKKFFSLRHLCRVEINITKIATQHSNG